MELRPIDVRMAGEDPEAFSVAVCDGAYHQGFLALTEHDIEQDLLDRARTTTFELLEHDQELLEGRYGRPNLFRQRGYSPNGTEKAVGATVPDDKTFWMSRSEEWPANPTNNAFGPNVWPDDLVPGFRPAILELMERSLALARLVLQGITRGYGMPVNSLVDATRGSETINRAIYYPPQDREIPVGSVRSAAHGDINGLTVLPGVAPGLELFLQGEWHRLHVPLGVVLVNTGEMLAKVGVIERSDRPLVPTIHRVVNPDNQHRGQPRGAWPTFVHFRRDYELQPGLLTGDWFDNRIREITTR